MTQNTELSQRLESLIAQQREIQAEIEAITIEQSNLKSEELHKIDEEVKELIEQMNVQFNSDEHEIDLNVRVSSFDHSISIFSKYCGIELYNLSYKDLGLEEIKKWSVEQLSSARFYRKLISSFTRKELSAAVYYAHLSIKINEDINIYPSYNPYTRSVTLKIVSFFTIDQLKELLRSKSENEIEFDNISTLDDKEEYILRSIETRKCSLDDMLDEINAIKAEKLGTIE